jgi:hypothetical protein
MDTKKLFLAVVFWGAVYWCSQSWAFSSVSEQKAEIIARNYHVLRRAAAEALFDLARQSISPVETCPGPLTNLSVCDITPDSPLLAPFLPAHWQSVKDAAEEARWSIRFQNGLCIVYGGVTAEEMAAIRRMGRHTLATAYCLPDGSCTPALHTASGVPITLPTYVLPEGLDGIAVSLVQVLP